MTAQTLDDVRTLLVAPSPAVLTTYRKDGSALTSPAWLRWTSLAFEPVIARDAVKLRHLEGNPECCPVIFETPAPVRGVELRGAASPTQCDVTEIRRSIATRYLGSEAGERFATARASTPGILIQLFPRRPRLYDLAAILPN
ncbi:MAG TPA: pyridoxamine 5'-phosphate oxidase family protein [Candidatus Dormibacteraeota bacterium]|nr:pyridoxamine 5'-phosphate oxidase family protein [Candidatus Dormibacteraeota bacterium]